MLQNTVEKVNDKLKDGLNNKFSSKESNFQTE